MHRRLAFTIFRCGVSSFSTHTATPIGSANVIRALDVHGVVAFVEKLGVSKLHAAKLLDQEVDGATLLEMTEDKLCDRCGLPLGSASAIMRAVSEAQSATLTIFPPKKQGETNNPIKVRLTPAIFHVKYVLSNAPLRLMSKHGAFLRELVTLEEAVEATRDGTTFLCSSRSFGDDLESVRGFVDNSANALEQETTRALADDEFLTRELGHLEAVNAAEHFTVSQRGDGKLLKKLEADGLVVGGHVALLNSVKHTPAIEHVNKVIEDAAKLTLMLTDFANVTTNPRNVKKQLLPFTRVVPFISGNNFSATVEAKCREKGVGFTRPDGSGFIVVSQANLK